MTTTIITKNSSTASAVPLAADLVQGELAVNVTDKRIYTENASGTVVELGTTPSSVTTGAVVCTTLSATGNVTLGDASTDTLNVGNGGLVKDASGNVGIGTSSPAVKFQVKVATDANAAFDTDGGTARLDFFNDAASANVNGVIQFNNLLFKANGSEKARIDSSGNLLVGTTNATLGAIGNFVKSNSTNYMIYVENTANTSGDKSFRSVLGANCNNSSSFHFVANTGGNDRLYIYGSGNVVNSNNSYGSLSDVKLKENVVDVTPKLEKINRVRIVNYNLIGDTNKQIGVIAQELEQVFPSLVEETPDRDLEGNDLGTTTKSVKYSVFVPMLIKAIQEQQALITTLTERITALEQA